MRWYGTSMRGAVEGYFPSSHSTSYMLKDRIKYKVYVLGRMWASIALRSYVVEAAGVRSSERRRRAWAGSSKRASEPNAEPRPRARWSTHYSPRTTLMSR